MAARFLSVFWVGLLLLLLLNRVSAGKKLIVIMIDGFKWDYMDDPELALKGFPRMIENGVRTEYVSPVYPSLSYPNWYSIVTGLFPESHHFVSNNMYDNNTEETFLMLPEKGSTDPHWWDKAEPIWVTAEKQGKNVAMYWWAGCEVEIRGVQPMICERHRYGPGTEEEKADYIERIDDIIQLFRPSRMDGLSLVLMYYGPVDYTGHASGPGTPETRRTLKDIDEILNEMIQKIEKAGMKNEVNVMIVSDHGMTEVNEKSTTFIDLNKFAPRIKHQIYYGATMMLVPEDHMLDKLYDDLKAENIKGLKIYKKEEIPESFHLKKSRMMNDIFLKAEKGYFIQPLNDSAKRVGAYSAKSVGYHGYDPDDVNDMRTVFFATGPGFRKGHTTKPMSNVDLYNMMCSVLDIQPLPNNGSLEILQDVLAVEGESSMAYNSAAESLNKMSVVLLFSILIAFYFSCKNQ